MSALFVLSALGGVLLASFVTMVAWNIQIEPRAFRCVDSVGFGEYWTEIGTHEGAGDHIAPGWTWENLELVRVLYIVTFFVLCLAITVFAYWTACRKCDLFDKDA